MDTIGIRELRQHASRWLERVARGESFEVTNRGRRVALLVPPPRDDGLHGLIASGAARPGVGYLGDLGRPRAASGAMNASEALERLRADER